MSDLAKLLGGRFIERRDVKAIQGPDGAYRPDRTKFTLTDIERHLAGEVTLGHYVVSPEGNCRIFCFDIDVAKDARPDWAEPGERREEIAIQLRAMAEGLARRTHRLTELPVAIAYSGSKGLHVYGFTGTIPAKDARELAHSVFDSFGCFEQFRGKNFWRHEHAYRDLEIEVYPKQDDLEGKDLGNLLRLPLGVHRKSGHRGYFIRCVPPMHEFTTLDPEAALGGTLPWA